jgi:hypothetical protein
MNKSKLSLAIIMIFCIAQIHAQNTFDKTVHQELILNILVPYNENPEQGVTTQMLAQTESIVMCHAHDIFDRHPILRAILFPSILVRPFIRGILQIMPSSKNPHQDHYIQALKHVIEQNSTYGMIDIIICNKYGHKWPKLEAILQHGCAIAMIAYAARHHKAIIQLGHDIWKSTHRAI